MGRLGFRNPLLIFGKKMFNYEGHEELGSFMRFMVGFI